MEFSDEKIREILELKDRINEKIQTQKKEIELLEKDLNLLDFVIKQSSFTKASSLGSEKKSEGPIPITKTGEEEIIGNAYVTPEKVSIILNENVGLDVETPPFKSFFLDRIIGEMRKKDSAEVESGKIQKESVIDCMVNKNGQLLREIVIKNYRQKERVKEIINTAAWSLSRMIENSSK